MIDRIFDNIARTVNHRPKLVVGIIGVVFIIALVGMTMITMQTGNDTYLDKNSPEGIANTQYTNTFAGDSLILIVETSDPLNPQVLNYLQPAGRRYPPAAEHCQRFKHRGHSQK